MKAKFDKFLNIFISKKLTVFIVACIFLGLEKIEGVSWVNVAMVYIGSQAVIDMIIKLRKWM